jgi:hypothetical protein
MKASEFRSYRWPLSSGRGALELCIAEESASAIVQDAGGEKTSIHVDDLDEWIDAFRGARRELGRASKSRPSNAFRRWTWDADKLLQEGTAAGMTPEELSRELGRSVNAVRLRLEESGGVPSESADLE